MALQSQAPRAGMSRRYVATNRRKKGLAPWLVLLGVAVIIGGLIYLFSGGDDPAINTANANPGTPTAEPGPAAAGQTPAPQRPSAPDNRTADNPAGSASVNTNTGGDSPPAPRYVRPEYIATANNPNRPLAGEAKDQFENGMQQLEAGNIVAGRALLSELLFREGALPRHEAEGVRSRLTNITEQHIFTKSNRTAEQIAADPIVELYHVQSGDTLGKIGNTFRTPYQLLERINNIKANRLQAGQKIQVIKGPVHARIDKSDYRMDLFVYDGDGVRIYLKSYPVGLGEEDSTPVGMWRVKPGSKVGPDAANGQGPSWRNPRTGKVYDSNDPDIPIGEYWMALEGTDDNTRGIEGYGIHATNDPSSIGRQASMGCVRMRDADVDEVFYTLFEGVSTVEIVR